MNSAVDKQDTFDHDMQQLHAADLQQANRRGLGRELFAGFRRNALSAEEGACTWVLN